LRQKQVTTYLECKKSFFGKIKYFFKGKGKIKEKNAEIIQVKRKKQGTNKEELIYDNKEYYTIEDLIEYSELEQQGIIDSDVVIILLPAGRGTHIELGMALALNKRIFLCSETKEEFSIENTVNFYQLPSIVRLVGTVDENLKEISKL